MWYSSRCCPNANLSPVLVMAIVRGIILLFILTFFDFSQALRVGREQWRVFFFNRIMPVQPQRKLEELKLFCKQQISSSALRRERIPKRRKWFHERPLCLRITYSMQMACSSKAGEEYVSNGNTFKPIKCPTTPSPPRSASSTPPTHTSPTIPASSYPPKSSPPQTA